MELLVGSCFCQHVIKTKSGKGVRVDCLSMSQSIHEHIHDRYLLLYDLLKNRNKQKHYLFDGLSGSKAPLQLLAMRSEEVSDEALLSQLSDEFLQITDPDRLKW